MMRISRAAFSPGRPPVIRPRAEAGMPRLLLILALAVVAAGGRPDAPAAQAGDRIVNFYNWSDYIDPAVIEAFTRETGIAVKYDTFDFNDILETKLLPG